jgi:hypothetical protein
LLLLPYYHSFNSRFLSLRTLQRLDVGLKKQGVNVSALAELRQHRDVSSLKSALHQLCGQFGRIARLDILTAMHEGTKQAICFMRMERPEQELQLMKALGVGRFGGEVVFVLNLNVPVASEDAGPSSQWADSDFYE